MLSFISVAGITEKELPKDTCPSGLLYMPIEGLTVAGNGTTVGLQGVDYVVFI